MKILYFDCPMGAAGDMLMGALFELCPDQAAFLQTFARLKLPGVALRAEPASSWGQNGNHMRLTVHDHEEAEHHHAHHHHQRPHRHRPAHGPLSGPHIAKLLPF